MTEATGNDQNKIAVHIREIQRLYNNLRVEAYYAATGHDAGELDAINMLGPAANVEAWEHKYETAERKAFANGVRWLEDYAPDQVGEHHPLYVLASWEDVVREELGTPSRNRATVSSAGSFLASSIPWMFDTDENGDVNFIQSDQLLTELRQCRGALENVLKDGFRLETGVPCMECGSLLSKVIYRNPFHAQKNPDSIDRPDTWECRKCETSSTNEQYQLAVRADYLKNATRLTATDMLEAYRVNTGTLQGWASKGHVRKRGKDDSGRRLYDVADTLKMRDGEAA